MFPKVMRPPVSGVMYEHRIPADIIRSRVLEAQIITRGSTTLSIGLGLCNAWCRRIMRLELGC